MLMHLTQWQGPPSGQYLSQKMHAPSPLTHKLAKVGCCMHFVVGVNGVSAFSSGHWVLFVKSLALMPYRLQVQRSQRSRSCVVVENLLLVDVINCRGQTVQVKH